MTWKNLDETKAFEQLKKSGNLVNPREKLDADRINSWSISAGENLKFYYAASLISQTSLKHLQDLAEEQQLIAKYGQIRLGEKINTGENRRVLHHLSRSDSGESLIEDGHDIGAFYRRQNEKIHQFSNAVHSGAIMGSTGKKFDTVVQIGIGGSDLGPRALHIALKGACQAKMKALFVSNVDPDDASEIIDLIKPESTLFVLVSKSGTTQETLANRDFIIGRMKSRGPASYDAAKHIVAVTSKTSPLAQSPDVLESFYIDDYIGGRFSSTSAVGGVVLSLAYGPAVFNDFLAGAHDADKRAMNRNLQENAPLMDAMIGIYNRNILGFPTTAILPYSQALSRFPAHLQQLDMESNGKSVNRYGQRLSYSTGPVIFGEPGTNSQHSFYQLLHQGSDIVPLQFIGFLESQGKEDLLSNGSTSHAKLNANLAAQIVAFAKGRMHKNSNKTFDGMRPSTVLVGKRLDAATLGALLAHFENKVMFQGLCWNVNSFDQEGVQLGKILTKSVLEGSSDDEALKTYSKILGV